MSEKKLNDAKLTLATLCDMVLGEDAKDRSDDALVCAVGELKRERDTAKTNALTCLKMMERAQNESNAATKRAEQVEADARELAAYAFISFPSDAYIVPAATLEKVLGLCEKYGAK